MSQSVNASTEFQKAILSNNTSQVAELLNSYPALREHLNDTFPTFAFGATPLLVAVQHRNRELVDLLLNEGANINGRSHWWAGGFGVLDDDRGLADFLISRGAFVDAHAAARLGKLDRLQELIAKDPRIVGARGGDGQTPLHFARSIEIVDCLLANGAEIDALDIDHESTPAQYMMRDRREIAAYLVSRGCRTDLLMAAALGNLALVEKTLKTDPESIFLNVSEKHFPKKNPQSGGTIYIWTLGQNKTPHILAKQSGHTEVFQFLMDRSPESLKLSMALELGDKALVQKLIHPSLRVPEALLASQAGKLVDAVQDRNVDGVRCMLEFGWPADARGQHGATALHWAAFHGHVELVKLLLQHHSPLEVLDTDFQGTPLGWAIYGSVDGWHRDSGDYPKTVEVLIQAGAKCPEKLGGTESVKSVLQRFMSA